MKRIFCWKVNFEINKLQSVCCKHLALAETKALSVATSNYEPFINTILSNLRSRLATRLVLRIGSQRTTAHATALLFGLYAIARNRGYADA